MRGLLVTEFTDFGNLTVVELPRPALEPKQVRIRVAAAGISFANNLMVAGKYQRKPPLPFTPGTECAGTVIEVGNQVTRFKPGDRVCAALDWGGYAEEAVAWEVNVYPIPGNLSFAQATNFNSYATAYAALTWSRMLDVQRGETLLVHGAAGAVGLAAVEIGKLIGATVIATASTEAKRALVKERGADHVIDYSGGEFRDAVNEITGGLGANAILDPVGGDVFDQSLRCIAMEGRIAPVGFTSGRAAQAPTNIVLVKNISVCGLNFGTYYGWSPRDVRYEVESKVRAIFTQFYRWVDGEMISPYVCATFPLEQFREAMAMVVERRSMGRVALVMD